MSKMGEEYQRSLEKAASFLLDGCIATEKYFAASYPENLTLKKEAVELVEYGLKMMFGNDWEHITAEHKWEITKT